MAIRRVVGVVPTVLIVLFMAMLLIDLSPTDPAILYAGEFATEQELNDVRERLGLSEPLGARYSTYLRGILAGDLGTSFRSNRAVAALIAESLPVTASLAVLAAALAVVIAIPFGLLAAAFHDRIFDRTITAVASFFIAVPPFVLALVLVVVAAIERDWLPVTGYIQPSDDLVEWLRHLALPSLAVALPSAAELARQIRGSVLDTREEDFIRAQYAKGLRARRILVKHVGKNAAVPVVTVLGLQITRILSGAVVIETLFVLPGFGFLAYQSVLFHDFPLIQGVVLTSAAFVLLVNLLVDLSHLYFSPVARYGAQA